MTIYIKISVEMQFILVFSKNLLKHFLNWDKSKKIPQYAKKTRLRSVLESGLAFKKNHQ